MKIFVAFSLLICAFVTITGSVQINGKNNFQVSGDLVQINGSLYMISYIKASFAEAVQGCNSIQMKLLSLQSETKQQVIAYFLNNNGYNSFRFWTSGIRYSDDLFMWSSTGQQFDYTNWYDLEPNETSTTIDVSVLMSTELYSRKWIDVENSDMSNFICEEIDKFN